MTFPYFRVTPQITRPIIPIILISESKFIMYSALIDSGADYCIFSIELAWALGVTLATKQKARFRGVGRGVVQGYWGDITLAVSDTRFPLKAIFAEMSDFGHGILGQKGFFDMFIVKFDLIKEEIELRERREN